MTIAVIAIAIIAGLCVALQGQFIGSMTRSAGAPTSVVITYGAGAILAAIIWLTRGAPVHGVRQFPWYAWTSGALGLVIVGGIGFATPRLGLSRTIIITVAAQLLAAILIDHFGLFSAPQRAIDVWRALGYAVTIAGVWLVVRGS